MVESPRFRKREMRSLDAQGIKNLLRAASGSELETPIAVAVGTGLRRGELLGLRWSDIDLSAGRLTVRRSIEVVREEPADTECTHVRYVRREKPPKTATSRRTVSLAPSVVAVLRRQRSEQRERRIHCGSVATRIASFSTV